MLGFEYIVAPVLGGVIGYITNDIAIRMLFRPHKAKYVCGIHIPFTPGIIPKEKGRIAEAIGGVISENLMNQEVLGRYLLSDEMVAKLRSSIEEFISTQKKNDETVRAFLSHYLSEEEIQSLAVNVNQSLTNQMSDKLTNPSVGCKVARLAMDYVANKLNGEGGKDLLSGFGGSAAALFGENIVGRFLGMLREPAEKFLANNINDMLRDNGRQIVSNMVGGEVESILDKKVCVLLEGRDEQLAKVVDTIEAFYRKVIEEHLPKILDTINISKIVSDRINEMDVAETEKLILQVMNKELKAIVWLGAGLGLIMGSLNCLIF